MDAAIKPTRGRQNVVRAKEAVTSSVNARRRRDEFARESQNKEKLVVTIFITIYQVSKYISYKCKYTRGELLCHLNVTYSSSLNSRSYICITGTSHCSYTRTRAFVFLPPVG